MRFGALLSNSCLLRTKDELEVVGAPVRLVFEAGETSDAPAQRLTEMVRGAPVNVYHRITATPVTSSGGAAFVGTYHSPELATSLAVTQADTVLNLTLRNASPRPLRSVGKDEFFGSGLSLQFTRDATGRVTGLVVNQGRARGIRFDRAVSAP
jgi:hypothetical protein